MRGQGDRQDRGPEPQWQDYLFFITRAAAVVLSSAVVAALLLTLFDLWGALGASPHEMPRLSRLPTSLIAPGVGTADLAGAGPTP